MTLKVWNGSAWTSVSTPKVWNGASWVTIINGKVWNGSAWVTFFENFRFSPDIPFTVSYSSTDPLDAQSDAFFKLNSNGTTSTGGNDTAVTDTGPTSWAPSGVTGSNYETQVIVTSITVTGTAVSDYHYVVVQDVAIPLWQSMPYTSPWTSLGTTPTYGTLVHANSDAGSTGNSTRMQGTVYVRRTGTSTPVISQTFDIYAVAIIA
jgi:hypothetical protein